ncbi:hypothetical protein Caka_0118 [Coraliomargarita akajimensis DSM 45221]|uniref:Uncharacterized protein n=2 Tax=Coraliomargarita TaxID=442430 RepID=D5EL45_CORAD|nr:hypothetical protein Caka_0118 [Coraliomargarita akajimensis DSM 45221]
MLNKRSLLLLLASGIFVLPATSLLNATSATPEAIMQAWHELNGSKPDLRFAVLTSQLKASSRITIDPDIHLNHDSVIRLSNAIEKQLAQQPTVSEFKVSGNAKLLKYNDKLSGCALEYFWSESRLAPSSGSGGSSKWTQSKPAVFNLQTSANRDKLRIATVEGYRLAYDDIEEFQFIPIATGVANSAKLKDIGIHRLVNMEITLQPYDSYTRHIDKHLDGVRTVLCYITEFRISQEMDGQEQLLFEMKRNRLDETDINERRKNPWLGEAQRNLSLMEERLSAYKLLQEEPDYQRLAENSGALERLTTSQKDLVRREVLGRAKEAFVEFTPPRFVRRERSEVRGYYEAEKRLGFANGLSNRNHPARATRIDETPLRMDYGLRSSSLEVTSDEFAPFRSKVFGANRSVRIDMLCEPTTAERSVSDAGKDEITLKLDVISTKLYKTGGYGGGEFLGEFPLSK